MPIDNRLLPDGKAFGVMTGYCEGCIRCPDW